MEIIIGRDQQTRKLCVIKDGSLQLYGKENSIPQTVSRRHFSMQSLGEGKWKIQNLNDRNVTYVNGIGVESKTVTDSDKIELGECVFLLIPLCGEDFSWEDYIN